MADSIVQGMFGVSPEQIQQQRIQQMMQNAQGFAQMTPAQQSAYGLNLGGQTLGGMLARSLGGVDPAEAMAQKQQQVLQGADTSTPEGLRALAVKFNQAGMPQQAYAAVQAANQMEASGADLTYKAAETDYKKAQAEALRRKETEPADKYATTVQKLINERSKYPVGSLEYKNLSDAIKKEVYIKAEESGMKPADYLRYMNQHSKDYGTASSVLDTSGDAISTISTIKNNPKFGYLFGGYTEKSLGKLSPGAIAGLQSDINTLKSNLKATGLNLVKASNQAGIGAITEREWPIFETMIADLDQKMDEKSARAKLDKIEAFFERTKKRAAEAYEKKWKSNKEFYDPSISDRVGQMPATTTKKDFTGFSIVQ